MIARSSRAILLTKPKLLGGTASWHRRHSRAAMAAEMTAERPKVIVLTGPTAVGKTAASLELAHRLNGEIISADSVQVYRGLDIGSAKVPIRLYTFILSCGADRPLLDIRYRKGEASTSA